MVDGAASLMAYLYGFLAQGIMNDVRGEGPMSGPLPYYAIYECADGLHLTVAAGEPQFYDLLVQTLGLDPAALPSRHDRARWPELREHFARVFRTRPRDEWDALLRSLDVCVAPVLSMGEAPRHEHIRARGTFIELEGVTQPAPAPRFSRTAADMPTVAQPVISPAAALSRWGVRAESDA